MHSVLKSLMNEEIIKEIKDMPIDDDQNPDNSYVLPNIFLKKKSSNISFEHEKNICAFCEN